MLSGRLYLTRASQLIVSFRHHTTACLSNNHEVLIISHKKKNEHFPLVWLRDNCRCPMCFHTKSNSRIINWRDFNISPKVTFLEVVDNDIILRWQDDHISKFNTDWLIKHSFLKESQNKYLEENYRPVRVAWNKNNVLSKIGSYSFEEVITQNATLHRWLMDLAKYGLAFLQNVPSDKNQCKKLANRIAFSRRTRYQDEIDVMTQSETSNAYLESLLQMHTDSPYYEYTPGITCLHCLMQTETLGEESSLSDGLYITEKLRKENKEIFDILSTVNVNWVDRDEHGEKYHRILRAPVIKLNSEGNVEKIIHSISQRDSHFSVDLGLVKPWYKALKVFIDLMYQERYQYKLKQGQLLAFDNTRIIYGGLTYKNSNNNKRHIIGCHIDWDEVYSKIRVLQN